MSDQFRQQVTNWFNKQFDQNKWDSYDLKEELGFLANKANEPVVDQCASMLDVNDPRDRRYIRVNNILSELARNRLYTMESLNRESKVDEKLEARIAKLEQFVKKSNKDLGFKAMRATEAVSKAADFISQIAISLEYEDNAYSSEWRSLEKEANNLIASISKLGFKL